MDSMDGSYFRDIREWMALFSHFRSCDQCRCSRSMKSVLKHCQSVLARHAERARATVATNLLTYSDQKKWQHLLSEFMDYEFDGK